MHIKNNKLTIVSRQSRLALTQAAIVQQQLLVLYPELSIDIIGISTAGDETLDTPLNKIGGKGLFVSELENYLLLGKADIAVHSMKDVPAQLASGLALGAIMSRADSRDVFVCEKFAELAELPSGSIVGTSSLRRQAQILALRPDLVIVPLRGNVETRLQKLVNGQYTAIILAAAGLQRLGLKQWLHAPIAYEQMLPAVGQGALGIEYNISRSELKELLRPLNDLNTAACVNAERVMNAMLDGGCQAPIAGYATISDDILNLNGLVASPDGKTVLLAQHSDSILQAEAIGKTVAKQLLAQGAATIIQDLKSMWQPDGW